MTTEDSYLFWLNDTIYSVGAYLEEIEFFCWQQYIFVPFLFKGICRETFNWTSVMVMHGFDNFSSKLSVNTPGSWFCTSNKNSKAISALKSISSPWIWWTNDSIAHLLPQFPCSIECEEVRHYSELPVYNTPYSKMAANLLLFCLHVNQPSLPHFHFKILLHFVHFDEANRAITM